MSPNGLQVAARGVKDKQIRVWDVATAKELFVLHGQGDAQYSPDSLHLFTRSNDFKTIRIWDAKTGHERTVIQGKYVLNLPFISPDGTKCAVVTNPTTTSVFDMVTGREMTKILQGDWIGVAWSPEGRRLAIPDSLTNSVMIYDASSGQLLAKLKGHSADITSTVFSANGDRIVTTSGDHTARLWDTETGQEVAILRGHKSRVQSAAFMPDGKRIVSAGEDGTVRLWDFRPGD